MKKIKNFTPDFSINTCFRSIKISNIYSCTFKPKIEKFETAYCVYHFRCNCNLDYYGQCKRKLKVRIREHNQPSRKSSIWLHISSCQKFYISKLFRKTSVLKHIEWLQKHFTYEWIALSSTNKKNRSFSNYLENDMFYFLQSYKMSYYHSIKFTVYYYTANYFQVFLDFKFKNFLYRNLYV